MEMDAFTGALVALLAKDMASAIVSEMGKDVSGAAKQVLRRLRQRLRREPDTRAAMEQLEADSSDMAVQERLVEQLAGKLTDPVFRGGTAGPGRRAGSPRPRPPLPPRTQCRRSGGRDKAVRETVLTPL